MTRTNYDVVVVGAGVAGLFAALELSQRGAKVCVVESESDGGRTSRSSAGLINPIGLSLTEPRLVPLCKLGRDMYREHARFWLSDGLDIGYTECGALVVARTSNDSQQLGALEELASQALEPHSRMDATQARAMEALLPESIEGGLWLPDEAWVTPLRLLDALRRVCEKRGVTLHSGDACRAIKTSSGGAETITSLRTLSSAQVVVAAGSKVGNLAGIHGAWCSMEPVRGQILRLQPPAGCPPPQRILYLGQHYLVARSDGTALFGASVEFGASEFRNTSEALATMLSALVEDLPAYAGAEMVSVGIGLRPKSVDGLPIIGNHDSEPCVFHLTGLFRHGILMAPTAARALAEMMLNGGTEMPVAEFSPNRFVSSSSVS